MPVKRSIPLIICALIFTVAAGSFGAYVWHWEHRPHVLEIYCFALDKSANSSGNLAVFIRTPDGHTILIDGGKSSMIAAALASVMPFYRRSIDTIISTNPDDSHVSGLVEVVNRYHVGQAIEPAVDISATSSAYAAFENSIAEKKVPDMKVTIGQKIDLGDHQLSAMVFFPNDPSAAVSTSSGFAFSKTNLPVLAFLISYGSTTILFGGDISKTEQKYVAREIASSSDFLGSAHVLLILPHAENSGIADESFFDSVKPDQVVVLKKPGTSGSVPKKKKDLTDKTPKKSKKPAKLPFSILDSASDPDNPNFSITNLTTDGDTEFISDGAGFIHKLLKY
jgi:beta-lactamase superfamily II metal-dependent hydrolase